ncbi:MAG: PIN domain nuclease [Ilumatobacteraceae bacterium]|jgi:predicted nucleic acid-binding protein|nr:PIN domain nuclease [Ilumatobacteraceae bacterium]
MSLIDTSAWIEYLRKTGSRTNVEVRRTLNIDAQICDVIRMEILAGARDQQHVTQLEKLLARATTIKTEPVDYDNAAAIYRACRKLGVTVRAQIDCLIAAIAIRTNTKIIHHDSDFDAIAQVTKLKVHPAKR